MSKIVKKGSYVEIKLTLLKPEERMEGLPEDTQKVPYDVRIKGFLLEDKSLGEEVEIETALHRKVKGTLIAVNPPFQHNFGEPVRELLEIGNELEELWEK